MTFLWLLTLVSWTAVIVYMAPAAWAASFGRNPRRGDPMRLACFSTAVMMAGFSLRWLLAPTNVLLWQILYVLSSVDAVYILMLARAYGRGGRIE
jgi:hypothetical protein